MKTDEKTRICANPACGKPLLEERANKKFCNYKCKYTRNNARARQRHRRDFKQTEDQLRHNVAVLKKLLQHSRYQNGRIERHYLDYEGFFVEACQLPSEAQKAIYPSQDIAWSHNYGIEVIAVDKKEDTSIEWITIHHNFKTNTL